MSEDLALLAAVVLLGCAYAAGVRRLWARVGPGRVVHAWRVATFAAGLAALALCVAGPLAHLAEERLWAHMVQHVTMVVVAAPLLVLGNPLAVLLEVIPAGVGRRARWWRRLSRSHSHPVGWVAWAAAALVVSTVAMWAWHAPGPYQAALRSPLVHGAQHLSFLGSGLFFWWAVIGARRRSLYGPGVLFIFVAAVQGTLLGAVMTFASRPWYPAYARVAEGGLTPMEDQQVAGVIMWGPGGAVYALAAILLFAAWLGRDEDQPVPERAPARA